MKDTEVIQESLTLFEDLFSRETDKKGDELFYKDLAKIDGVEEFLKRMLSHDIRLYFMAQTPVEQLTIRGAYFRTYHIYKQLMKSKGKTIKAPIDLDNTRTE